MHEQISLEEWEKMCLVISSGGSCTAFMLLGYRNTFPKWAPESRAKCIHPELVWPVWQAGHLSTWSPVILLESRPPRSASTLLHWPAAKQIAARSWSLSVQTGAEFGLSDGAHVSSHHRHIEGSLPIQPPSPLWPTFHSPPLCHFNRYVENFQRMSEYDVSLSSLAPQLMFWSITWSQVRAGSSVAPELSTFHTGCFSA